MFKGNQTKFIGLGLVVSAIVASIVLRFVTTKVHLLLKDRVAAGEILTNILVGRLKDLKSTVREEIVVVAIPRGGVIVGDVISRRLFTDLKLILGFKIGEPVNKEYSIGAVMEDGSVYLDQRRVKELRISADYIEQEISYAMEEISRRRTVYSRGTQSENIYKNKTVILVDDGAATGATIIAGARYVRRQNPKRLIIALPVLPRPSIRQIKCEADELEVILTPRKGFVTVGQYYQNFPPVSDN